MAVTQKPFTQKKKKKEHQEVHTGHISRAGKLKTSVRSVKNQFSGNGI